jgi:hypothetical protein
MNPLFKCNMKYKLTVEQKATLVATALVTSIMVVSLILNRLI